MTVILLVVALATLAAAARRIPIALVLGLVAVAARLLAAQDAKATETLLRADAVPDPWAVPGDDLRRAMRRSLGVALARTELRSCFPDAVG